MSQTDKLKVMVLAGGPDKERPVSLKSGRCVAHALRQAGHEVVTRDISPSGEPGLAALDEFAIEKFDVIFPALHGGWGEGGGLQKILDQRQVAYVGSGAVAAALCMDKNKSKLVFAENNLPTAPFELLNGTSNITITAPAVVKPAKEGSSISLSICQSNNEIKQACDKLSSEYDGVLIEKYIAGRELTVGVLEGLGADPNAAALPVIEIVPAVQYYDYDAKYQSQETRYHFDIDLPGFVLEQVKQIALKAHKLTGAGHLSRCDFLVDNDNRPWILEINTMPGFTDHSLVPMAAQHAGMNMAQLTDHLVRLALGH